MTSVTESEMELKHGGSINIFLCIVGGTFIGFTINKIFTKPGTIHRTS